MNPKISLYLVLALFLIFSFSCQKQGSLDGHWRAIWISSGGEIPADMFLRTNESGQLKAEVHNASEVIKFDRVQREKNHLDFFIDHFECEISADLAKDGKSMNGKWSKQTGTPNEMPFSAIKGDLERFPKDKYPPPTVKSIVDDISGTWKWRFEGDEYDSVGMFKQEGEKVTGTVRAIDGDFRWLEGVYRNGLLLLSSFNGSWVFLFKAEMDENGIFRGFWARGPREPIKWQALKDETATLPDTFNLTELSNKERLIRFQYPLAEDPQRLISPSDPEFSGKPLLVALTMTGCPNSHQNAELLSQLYKDYHEKGLNMLSVQFELIKDVARIQSRIKIFKQKYDLPFPVLFSFAMSKEEVAKEIPDLERFLAWPTVVFIGPDGKVDSIHTGFDGPATGEYYLKMVQGYRERIERLLLNMTQ